MTLPLSATDQLFEAKDYKNLIVVYRNGAPVRLSDLGRVIDGTEDVRNTGLSRGRPAVMIWVNRQPNANIIDTVDRIKALLPQFQASLPPGVRSRTSTATVLSPSSRFCETTGAQRVNTLMFHFSGDPGRVGFLEERVGDLLFRAYPCRFR